MLLRVVLRTTMPLRVDWLFDNSNGHQSKAIDRKRKSHVFIYRLSEKDDH